MKIRIVTTALALSLTTVILADEPAQAKTTASSQTTESSKPQVTVDRSSRAASSETLFARYDKDKDGRVTAEEFRGGKTLFKAYDTDDDGVLTLEEIKNAKAAASGPNFRELDTDKDGFVTRREWQGTQEEFDAVDLDHDGVWSKLDRAIEKRRMQAKGELEMLDTNKDAIVSGEEWAAKNRDEQSFRRRDLNRNGELDLEELATPVQKQH